MEKIYTLDEAFKIQDTLVKWFPLHKISIYRLFRDPFHTTNLARPDCPEFLYNLVEDWLYYEHEDIEEEKGVSDDKETQEGVV